MTVLMPKTNCHDVYPSAVFSDIELTTEHEETEGCVRPVFSTPNPTIPPVLFPAPHQADKQIDLGCQFESEVNYTLNNLDTILQNNQLELPKMK